MFMLSKYRLYIDQSQSFARTHTHPQVGQLSAQDTLCIHTHESNLRVRVKDAVMVQLCFVALFAALTLVAAHGSGAWLDLRHHSASSSYSGVRVRAVLFPLRVSSPSVNMTNNECPRVRCRSMFRRPRAVSH